INGMTLKKIGKIALWSAGFAALAYFGGGLVAGWILVRPGKRRDYDCVPGMRYGKMQPLTLLSSDGLRLHAWVLLSRKASPEDWVVLLHGYRSDRSAVQNRARFFSRRGFNALLLHFRAHGSSDPATITSGYTQPTNLKAASSFIR